jgi:HK97 gp10 family phage protein
MIKVEGLAELEKALFQLGSTSTARRVGQRALMVAAEPMVDAIKALAPKDRPMLVQAITAKPSNRNRGNDTASVVIGIDSEVDPAVWKMRKRGKGGYRDPGVAGEAVVQEFGTEKMQANPFMRPGFDATAAEVIVAVGRTLGPEIEKAAARQARRAAKAGA